MPLNKKQTITLLSGVMFGILLTLALGFVGLKVFKKLNKPARYGEGLLQLDERTEGNPFKDKKGFQVKVASSLDRIFQDGKTLLKPTFSDAAVLSLARHEYEAFQIVLQNGQSELKDVEIEVGDLKSDSGHLIPSQNISWRIVGYVPTQKPYYPVKYVGLWPDPLMPAQKISIEPNTVQPFWITVYADQETPAGIYKGSVKVKAQAQELSAIPIEVTVYDFTLPKEGHLKTAFDLYEHETHWRFPKLANENDADYHVRLKAINMKFLEEMLKYRMNPILNIDPTKDSDLARLDRLRTLGLPQFGVGRLNGTFGNNWPKTDAELEALVPLYRTYAEILKMNKIFDMQYLYTWDESSMGDPLVSKICRIVHKADPGFKNMVCYHGFWDPEKHPGWGDDIDIWTFQIDDYDPKGFERVQKEGIEMWMYISGPSGFASPNLALDFDSIDYRIVPWICYKYGIKGFLYWCVNWWGKVDPFKSAANTKWEQNGNGLLFYPGNDEPIPSLRVEIFRDGMEDFEYIYLLEELLKTKKVSPGVAAQAKALLNTDGIVNSTQYFTKDEAVLKKRRHEMAMMIEQLQKLN